MDQLYLLLGSDIQPRLHFLEKAADDIQNGIGAVLKKSSLYESEAWGFESKMPFLNQVLQVETNLEATEVLKKLKDIELIHGRKRLTGQYTSRTLDIDILYYGNTILDEMELIVPHSRLHQRRFTLLPLVELIPHFIHPKLNMTQIELLENCTDDAKVWRYDS